MRSVRGFTAFNNDNYANVAAKVKKKIIIIINKHTQKHIICLYRRQKLEVSESLARNHLVHESKGLSIRYNQDIYISNVFVSSKKKYFNTFET